MPKRRYAIRNAAFVLLAGLFVVPMSTVWAACTTGVCVRDDFSARTFNGSSGTKSWGSNWIETGDSGGASGGNILIQTVGAPNYLEFNDNVVANQSWSRCVGSFPADAQADSIYFKAAIWSDVNLGAGEADRIIVEYSIADPDTSCGDEPVSGWTTIYSNNADRSGWTDIAENVDNALRGVYFWLRIRMNDRLESNEFHRFDYVEVSYLSALDVTFTSLGCSQSGNAIRVSWETASELNNRGFNVWRATADDAPQNRLNTQLIPSLAAGSPGGHLYSYSDAHDLVAGTTYYYWVEAVGTDGSTTFVGPLPVEYRVPTAVTLSRSQSAAPTLLLPAVTLLALVALLPVALRARRR